MTVEEMWHAYTHESGIPSDTPYQAWAFGGAPDILAALTLAGTKTATASAYALYAIEGERLPEAGDYSVITDSADCAVCVIRNTRVYVTPYDHVSEEHAYREGEGDRSLAYWRTVHEEFFRDCLREAGLSFATDMDVVCEEFEVVYPSRDREANP